MTDIASMFGIEIADAKINWPARGSSKNELCDRDGWSRVENMPTMMMGKPATVPAMKFQSLAVNVMIGSEGFATCLAHNGYRLSFGGRVFAKCEDAMKAVECMIASGYDWRECFDRFPETHRLFFKYVMESAEQRGEIHLDRVYPS